MCAGLTWSTTEMLREQWPTWPSSPTPRLPSLSRRQSLKSWGDVTNQSSVLMLSTNHIADQTCRSSWSSWMRTEWRWCRVSCCCFTMLWLLTSLVIRLLWRQPWNSSQSRWTFHEIIFISTITWFTGEISQQSTTNLESTVKYGISVVDDIFSIYVFCFLLV